MKLLKIVFVSMFVFSLSGCQQPSSGKSFNKKFSSKINFSYERYYIRAAKCELKTSDYIRESSFEINKILGKVEKKAVTSEANWAVITGLGEGEVKDHYFFETYNCNKSQTQEVIANLDQASKINAPTKSAKIDETLSKRDFTNFQSVMRTKFDEFAK